MATTPKRRRSRGSGGILKLSSGYYAYQYVDADGKRKTKSLRTKNRAEAEERAATFTKAQDATDKEDVLREIGKARQLIKSRDLPIADVWDAFEATNPTASAGTLENYCRALRDFSEWLELNVPSLTSWTQVDQKTASDYLAYLWGTGISANTYNYRRNALGHITKKLAPSYHIESNPWELTERKAEVKQKRLALTADQATRLLGFFDDPERDVPHRDELRVVALLCMYAGLRLKDACLLTWASVDLDAGKIEYTPAKTAKTGRTALVPILPPLHAALRSMAAEAATGPILPDLAETYRRNPDGIQKPLVELVQDAAGTDGIEGVGNAAQRKVTRSPYGAHSLRHTFATMAAMAGAKAAYLARMLGDNITTVQRYYVHVGFGMTLLHGFSDVPKMIEAKATSDPERAQLHRLADELPLEAVREVLRIIGRGQGSGM